MSQRHVCKRVGFDFLETAANRQVHEQRIHATPAQIFEVLADAGSWPQWVGAITHVRWTSEPPYGPGSTRTVTLKGNLVVDEEFLLWENGEHMAFIFTNQSQPVFDAFAEDYRVFDNGDGTCTLRWTFCLRPKLLARPFIAALGPLMRRGNRTSLRRLRDYVEARYPALER